MTEADQTSDGYDADPTAADRHRPEACDVEGKTSELVDDQPESHEFFGKGYRRIVDAEVEFQPGNRIGIYELRRKLGSGATGQVWLARHKKLEIDRAIKLLDPRFSMDRHWRSRMLREARILARLNHPNIATLYEFIDEQNRNCIVLEYVIGRTLAEVIRRPLPVGRSIAICSQIAQALHYAHSHEQPVVHRDLKPRNVMIRDDDVVKVVDWGIAQALVPAIPAGLPKQRSRRTPRHVVAGTPGYMSPEQACGKQADRRADIWALGCVLYEMLTGTPAFPQNDLDSFIDAVISSSSSYPDWSRLPEELPNALEDLLRDCLERDLRKRLDRTGLVVDRLQQLARAETKVMSGTSIPDEPDTATRQRVPSNVPPAMTSFVGREHVMDQIRTKFRQSRLLTLTGPGGTGKTTLAVRLARAIAQDESAHDAEQFTGGIWLAELAPVSDPELVVQTIAATLAGQPARSPGTKPEEIIAARIGDQPTLLILDNCEHLCDVCRDVAGNLLRCCPHLRIIATSRQRLVVPGEQVYRVPPLSVPKDQPLCTPDVIERFESVQLFVERATETRHDFALTDRNAADVAKICRMLEGMPLAIELAAARTSAIAVRQLAERIADRFRMLDRASAGSTRRRTLEATIRWSFDLLSEAEQKVFTRLSIFRGGWTLEAAEAVVADSDHEDAAQSPDSAMRDAPVDEQPSVVSSDAMLDLLEGLVEKSLVIFEEVDGWPRYRMYETIRMFAEESLRKSSSSEVIESLREKHARFFLEFAGELSPDDSGPKQAVVLERIEYDHDNFRAAIEWALIRSDDPDFALELAHRLHWFYFVRGYGSEGLRWLRAALANRPASGDLLAGRAMNSAGMLSTLLHDNVTAQAYYERSLKILRALEGQDYRVAGVLNNLGILAQTQEDRQAAFDAYEEAVAMYDRMKRPIGRARVQLNLAAVNMFADNLGQAKALLHESLTVLSQEQDEVRVAEIHQLLCEIAERESRRDDAIKHYRESIALRARNREHGAILRNYVFAVIFAFDAGQFEVATRLIAYITNRPGATEADIPERHRQRLDPLLRECRDKLGPATFERVWASGSSMDRVAVCELARSAV